MKISVCYMVKNEEENLARSLASLPGRLEDLVVVDTGSTDGTREVARRSGARLFDAPWTGDFSAPRNAAIELAKGDWILFLDADESFEPGLRDFSGILREIEEKGGDALLFRRRNIESLERPLDASVDWSVRAFRRSDNLRYIGAVHEQITRLDGGTLDVHYADPRYTLLHTGYAGSLGEAKARRNLGILLADIARRGPRPSDDVYLTDCYYGIQDYERAMHCAEKVVKKDSLVVYGGKGHIYHTILECMRHLHRPDAAMLPWADAAIRAYPDLPEFYAERGMVLCGMGQLPAARASLLDALIHYESHTAKPEHESYFQPRIAAQIARRLAKIAALYHDEREAAYFRSKAAKYEKA